ncbi:MAG: hypothetical protein ACK55I_36420 [bacterium]
MRSHTSMAAIPAATAVKSSRAVSMEGPRPSVSAPIRHASHDTTTRFPASGPMVEYRVAAARGLARASPRVPRQRLPRVRLRLPCLTNTACASLRASAVARRPKMRSWAWRYAVRCSTMGAG